MRGVQPCRTAAAEFIEVLEECRYITTRITERMDDFLGVHAEECKWADVADARRLLDTLKAAGETLRSGL